MCEFTVTKTGHCSPADDDVDSAYFLWHEALSRRKKVRLVLTAPQKSLIARAIDYKARDVALSVLVPCEEWYAKLRLAPTHSYTLKRILLHDNSLILDRQCTTTGKER